MKPAHYLIPMILLVVSVLSCNKTDKLSTNREMEVIAEIDGVSIYANELNVLIKQEMFDELNRIYEMKRKALEQLINVKILQKEADKKQLYYQQYIDYYVDSLRTLMGTDSLYRRYRMQSAMEIRDGEMYNTATESSVGKYTQEYLLRGAIVDELLDSLKRDKRVTQYLYPPKSPFIDLKPLHAHYRGNLQSKVSVTIISDFDCTTCIRYHKLYDSIYHEYDDDVKFGYIHYSAAPTLAQVASEAANKQDKFWEFHDSLYAYKGYIDSTAIYRIAQSLSMDAGRFKRDLAEDSCQQNIQNTINQLNLMGVYATPTILVNGRFIMHSNSKEEITHLIDKELSK